MGPKPIQDVAPPPRAASLPAEPPSGPEIVGDIPVRASAQQTTEEQQPQSSKNDDSSFIIPAASPPAAINKDNQKLRNKDSKPRPTLAIVVTLLAVICVAAGAYLKYFSNR